MKRIVLFILGMVMTISEVMVMRSIADTSVGASLFSNVGVYPNPWKKGKHDRIHFSNLPANSHVTIYTISGQKVRTLEFPAGGDQTWDVDNDRRNLVASGVYLYRISAQGQVKKGKLVVIK